MILDDLLNYVYQDGSTKVIAKTKDGIKLGSSLPHEEFPPFTWTKDVDHIDGVNGERIVT